VIVRGRWYNSLTSSSKSNLVDRLAGIFVLSNCLASSLSIGSIGMMLLYLLLSQDAALLSLVVIRIDLVIVCRI
jgi:hypothetical protein